MYLYIYLNASRCDKSLFLFNFLYVSNSALFLAKYFGTSLLHTRSLDAFYRKVSRSRAITIDKPSL